MFRLYNVAMLYLRHKHHDANAGQGLWIPACFWVIVTLGLGLWLISSCRFLSGAALPVEPSVTMTPSQSPSFTQTPQPTTTVTPSPSPSPTRTNSPTITATETPIPTYITLRGKVLVRSNCRYGPGYPYLYKYGLVPGSNLDIIGRTDTGSWILIQAIGGNNPCWVKASLMDIKGDVMNVQPTYIPLPPSPYYRPPSAVTARREGNQVIVSWNPISLRAGDDQAAARYVVEAWVCLAGKQTFMPVGSYIAEAVVPDEPGCSEPSHGRLLAAEKHGYTLPVEVPWPQAVP
jgi:SH3-like domain-containing protein